MTTQTTTETADPATEPLPRIVELAREVGGMLDDAYAHRTDFGDCSDCAALTESGPRTLRTLSGPDPLCDDHAEDLEIAEGWEHAVGELQIAAAAAVRDSAALDELAAIVRNTSASATSAAELLSRVSAVLVDAARQVSPTTD